LVTTLAVVVRTFGIRYVPTAICRVRLGSHVFWG
jgi:hypothetical protein